MGYDFYFRYLSNVFWKILKNVDLTKANLSFFKLQIICLVLHLRNFKLTLGHKRCSIFLSCILSFYKYDCDTFWVLYTVWGKVWNKVFWYYYPIISEPLVENCPLYPELSLFLCWKSFFSMWDISAFFFCFIGLFVYFYTNVIPS